MADGRSTEVKNQNPGKHIPMDIRSFQHITPPLRLFSGPDSLGQLGRELDRLNSRRAVIVCGSSLARGGSPLDLVRSAMGDRCAGLFSGVRAHSPIPVVQAAAQELKRLEADAIVAVGGGSAIVTARAASILLAETGDIRALATSRDERGQLKSPRLAAPKLPQLVIPTTPNTATVKAGSAVFDPEGGERLALFDPKTRAQSVFIHPDLIKSAPRDLVISASLDTFTLALEGLTSQSGDPISDALLMHAVRLLAQYLPSQDLGEDPGARGELALAAILCGQGTDFTGAGMATVLGHAIGARHKVENGVSKAIALPYVLRFNADAAQPGLLKVATALGLGPSQGEPLVAVIIGALEGIFSQLGIPRRLRDVGVPREALTDIAASAMGDWFLRGNPRPVRDAPDVQQVLEEAW
jgi:alcohol dehydrogenase class IV